jgi:hypothetical protein
MNDNRLCVVHPACPERTRYRCGDAAAHAAVSDIEHKGNKRDDQRCPSQRVYTEPADENAIGNANYDLHQHQRRGRTGQLGKAPANGRG